MEKILVVATGSFWRCVLFKASGGGGRRLSGCRSPGPLKAFFGDGPGRASSAQTMACAGPSGGGMGVQSGFTCPGLALGRGPGHAPACGRVNRKIEDQNGLQRPPGKREQLSFQELIFRIRAEMASSPYAASVSSYAFRSVWRIATGRYAVASPRRACAGKVRKRERVSTPGCRR